MKGQSWGVMSHEVVINSESGGATNLTAGAYTCQVVYLDEHKVEGSITSSAAQLKLQP